MAKLPQHPFDSIADELSRWIHDEASWYSTALTEGYQTPFSADVSPVDKLAYYRRAMFKQNPDGTIDYNTPNTEGRDALYKRVTPEQYADIALAVSPGKGIEHIQRLSVQVPEEEMSNAESTSGNSG
jgi:hypothetical protein